MIIIVRFKEPLSRFRIINMYVINKSLIGTHVLILKAWIFSILIISFFPPNLSTFQGTIRFIGEAKFAPGEWAGVELDQVCLDF